MENAATVTTSEPPATEYEVTAADPSLPSPATEPTDEEMRRGEELYALMLGADRVLAVPSDVVNGQVLGLLAMTAGRLVVPAEIAGPDGEPVSLRVAVRPDDDCKDCRGSLAYRYKSHGEKLPSACRCIYRAINAWRATLPGTPVAPAKLPAGAVSAPVVPAAGKAQPDRAAELRSRVEKAEEAKAAALAPFNEKLAKQAETTASAKRVFEALEAERREVQEGAGGVRAQIADLHRQIAELERAATALEEDAAARLPVVEQADRAVAAERESESKIVAERGRIERWHDRKMEPAKKTLARIERRCA